VNFDLLLCIVVDLRLKAYEICMFCHAFIKVKDTFYVSFLNSDVSVFYIHSNVVAKGSPCPQSPREDISARLNCTKCDNHVAEFHDLCPRQVHDFVGNLSRPLSQTSRHVEMVCVHDFPRGEVSLKVDVM